MLDLDTGRVIRQDLDAQFSLTIGCPGEGDDWDEDGLNFEWLIDEGTPIMGIHDIEYDGERYEVTVEIKRVPTEET